MQRSFMNRFTKHALVLAAVLLIGCQDENSKNAAITAPTEPATAVAELADALAKDDIVRFRRLSLPPALYEKEKSLWRQRMDQAAAPTEEQARDYANFINALTDKDADKKLLADLTPKLKALESELGMRWPLTVAMASSFAQAAVSANETLNKNEKAHANSVVSALAAWANDDPKFARPEYAQRAISAATKTAKKLDLPTLEQARLLEMEPALEKVGVLSRGVKEIIAVYGINLNDSLAALATKVVDQPSADETVVEVSYPLHKQTISFQITMLQRDGRWYPAQTVRDIEQEALAAKTSEPAADNAESSDNASSPATAQ